MSKARDVRYGRRGGRWAESTTKADEQVEEFHRHRLRCLRRGDGSWPQWEMPAWRARAVEAEDLVRRRRPLSDLQRRALEIVEAEQVGLAAAAAGPKRQSPREVVEDDAGDPIFGDVLDEGLLELLAEDELTVEVGA